METIEQQALRMACDSFLSDYEGTPDLATIDLMLITATIWEPFGHIYRDWETDRKSTRLNSSHSAKSRMPSSA